jgi:hypothetical protein
MKDLEAAIAALQKFGYTERQAEFLRVVALHGGYFQRRQYLFYTDNELGGTAQRLIDRLVASQHVKTVTSCDRTAVYQLCARPLYAAIGAEDNRNRRFHQPFAVRTKLMALDFVLSHPEAEFFATEQERVALFTERLGLPITVLPAKSYVSKSRASRTVRYFVDKNPVFLPAATEGAAPAVAFAYIHASSDTTAGFRTFLAQYQRLFEALPAFRLVFVASNSRLVPIARKDFRKALHSGARSGAAERETDRLLAHFEARLCHERRDYSGFDTAGIQRLSRELKEFAGPKFDWLFAQYKTQGTARVLAEIAPERVAEGQGKGIFEAYVLGHSYEFVGDGWPA